MNVKELVKALTHVEMEKQTGLHGYLIKIGEVKSVKEVDEIYQEATAVYNYLFFYKINDGTEREKLKEGYSHFVERCMYKISKCLNTKVTSAYDEVDCESNDSGSI